MRSTVALPVLALTAAAFLAGCNNKSSVKAFPTPEYWDKPEAAATPVAKKSPAKAPTPVAVKTKTTKK